MPTADTVGECQPKAWAFQLRDAPRLQPEATQSERDAEERRIQGLSQTRAEESDFRAQWGLGAINAHYAYARGATGTGVTVGVIDSGVYHIHSEFRNKLNDDSLLFYKNDLGDGTNDLTQPPAAGDPDALPAVGPLETQIEYIAGELSGGDYPDRDTVCLPPGILGADRSLCPAVTKADGDAVYWRIPFEQEIGHGTLTVSTTVGIRGNSRDNTPYGVAYNANVLFAAFDFGNDDPPILSDGPFLGYLPLTPAELSAQDPDYSESFMPFIARKTPVINLSFGVRGLVDDLMYSASNLRTTGLPTLIPLMEQEQTHPGERTVFVWAAGNENQGTLCSLRLSDHGCTMRSFADLLSELTRRGFTFSFSGGPSIPVNSLTPEQQESVARSIGLINAASPDVLAGLPYHLPELRGHTLAVVSVDRDGASQPARGGEISDFSNHCGELPATGWDAMRDGRHYCLAAPGRNIRAALSQGGHTTESGTSLAAPHVAGAIAVLIQFFTDRDGYQNVGNTAIVRRILETANREGIYEPNRFATVPERAYSTIYGAGLLDLKAATEPTGMAMMMTSGTLNGPAVPLSQTRLSAGRAYGDAFTRAFGNTRVAAFDSMQFPFWHPLTSLVESPSARTLHYHRARFSPPSRIATHLPGVGTFRLGVKTLPPIPRRAFRRPDATDPARRRPSSLSFRRETASGSVFAAWRSPGSTPLSLRETLPTPLSSEAFTHPFMSFADNGISVGVRAGALTAAAFTDPDAPSPVHGMALDYALLPYLSAQAGMVSEKGGALGLRPAGAFGGLSTTSTAFTGLKLDAPVSPRWRVLSHAHFGTARPDVSGIGLVKEVSPLLVSAFSAGVSGHGVLTDGDSLTLAVSQPLRVERGRVSLVVPTGRTPDGELRRVGVDAGLEPSGREVTLSAAWTAPVGDAAYVRLAAGASREPGHDAAADDAFHALADVSFRF